MTRTFRFRATEADAKRLRRLSKHYDRRPSDVLRRLIADECTRIDNAVKPKKERHEHGNEESK